MYKKPDMLERSPAKVTFEVMSASTFWVVLAPCSSNSAGICQVSHTGIGDRGAWNLWNKTCFLQDNIG